MEFLKLNQLYKNQKEPFEYFIYYILLPFLQQKLILLRQQGVMEPNHYYFWHLDSAQLPLTKKKFLQPKCIGQLYIH